MEIDINQYLSEEDKKNIAEEEYRSAIRQLVQVDKERILSNCAYTVVQKLVDEAFNEDLNTILVNKVKDIIDDLSPYSVFKRKDAWDRDESKGQKYLDNAVEANKVLIEQKVQDIIVEMDVKDFHYRLEELMYSVVENRLLGRSFTGEDK